jgi:hypothetical protein
VDRHRKLWLISPGFYIRQRGNRDDLRMMKIQPKLLNRTASPRDFEARSFGIFLTA